MFSIQTTLWYWYQTQTDPRYSVALNFLFTLKFRTILSKLVRISKDYLCSTKKSTAWNRHNYQMLQLKNSHGHCNFFIKYQISLHAALTTQKFNKINNFNRNLIVLILPKLYSIYRTTKILSAFNRSMNRGVFCHFHFR